MGVTPTFAFIGYHTRHDLFWEISFYERNVQWQGFKSHGISDFKKKSHSEVTLMKNTSTSRLLGVRGGHLVHIRGWKVFLFSVKASQIEEEFSGSFWSSLASSTRLLWFTKMQKNISIWFQHHLKNKVKVKMWNNGEHYQDTHAQSNRHLTAMTMSDRVVNVLHWKSMLKS